MRTVSENADPFTSPASTVAPTEFGEPWTYDAGSIKDAEQYFVNCNNIAGPRIVACVNACAGIPTSALEDGRIKRALEMHGFEESAARLGDAMHRSVHSVAKEGNGNATL